MPQQLSTTTTAEHIREWVETVGNAAGPKPIALPYLRARDPSGLARITLSAIREGIVSGHTGLARLALVIGATAEHEASGQPGGRWGTEAQVRVGLALIDCAMRATGWFVLSSDPRTGVGLAGWLGPRLRLEVKPGAMDAARHCLDREVPVSEGYRPAIRDLAPPHRTIKTLMGGKCLEVALAEAADDLAGDGAELGCARAAARPYSYTGA